MKICYVTGNELKIKLAKKIFKDLDVEIIQENIDTPEIQSLDCEEVSKYSAKYASNLLGKPVLKNDTAFCIEALDNFPGALAKYCESTIGADGYIKLLEGKENRGAFWIETLSYCKPNEEPISFSSYTYGTISEEVRDGRGHDYDKIFIPKGDTRTFSQMSEEEHIGAYSDEAYIKIYEYLKKEEHDNK